MLEIIKSCALTQASNMRLSVLLLWVFTTMVAAATSGHMDVRKPLARLKMSPSSLKPAFIFRNLRDFAKELKLQQELQEQLDLQKKLQPGIHSKLDNGPFQYPVVHQHEGKPNEIASKKNTKEVDGKFPEETSFVVEKKSQDNFEGDANAKDELEAHTRLRRSNRRGSSKKKNKESKLKFLLNLYEKASSVYNDIFTDSDEYDDDEFDKPWYAKVYDSFKSEEDNTIGEGYNDEPHKPWYAKVYDSFKSEEDNTVSNGYGDEPHKPWYAKVYDSFKSEEDQ